VTYALGQSVAFTDSGHASASTGVVTITKPDGTTTTATGTLAASVWTAGFTPDAVGLHQHYWTFTGTGAGITTPDVFDVRALTARCPVSLAALRKHLNWPTSKSADEDADLLEKASEATSVIEGVLSRPLMKRTYTLAYEHGVTDLVLPNIPCHCDVCAPYAVLTVSTSNSDTVTTTPSGVLSGLTSDATLTYVAGYTSPPSWAVLAVKRMTEHLWGRTVASRLSRDPKSSQENEPSALSYLLPYAVQSLVRPHRLKGG
jgi:hypothetical protein